jgi:hypothetical protein
MKSSPPDPVDGLRALLHDRAKAAANLARSDGGRVSAAELEELERLSRLVKLGEAAGSTSRKRWPVATALGATLLIVSLLLFTRVPTTEVELDLAASEAAFVVPSQQVLTERLNLSAVGIAGAVSIELPRPLGAPATTPADGDLAIRIAATSVGNRVGRVNLSALTVLPGTRVGIQRLEGSPRYRLSLRGADLVVRVGVLGPTEIGLAGMAVERVDFRTPRSIVLKSGAHELTIDLSPSTDVPTLNSPLPVTRLALFRVDEYPEGDHTVVRRVSTIESGSVFLESLNGQERKLRAGQRLDFDEIQGEMRTLRLGADHVALKLGGRVRGMTTGSGSTERSLMPTVLDWMYARHGVSLLWGTTLYVFGLGVGITRWWKGSS